MLLYLAAYCNTPPWGKWSHRNLGLKLCEIFCILCFANERKHLVSFHYLFIGSKCFFSISMREFFFFFSSSEDKDTVAQVSFYKTKQKKPQETLFHVCTAHIYAPYKYHTENVVLTRMVRNSVSDLFFNYSWVLCVGQKRYPFLPGRFA